MYYIIAWCVSSDKECCLIKCLSILEFYVPLVTLITDAQTCRKHWEVMNCYKYYCQN